MELIQSGISHSKNTIPQHWHIGQLLHYDFAVFGRMSHQPLLQAAPSEFLLDLKPVTSSVWSSALKPLLIVFWFVSAFSQLLLMGSILVIPVLEYSLESNPIFSIGFPFFRFTFVLNFLLWLWGCLSVYLSHRRVHYLSILTTTLERSLSPTNCFTLASFLSIGWNVLFLLFLFTITGFLPLPKPFLPLYPSAFLSPLSPYPFLVIVYFGLVFFFPFRSCYSRPRNYLLSTLFHCLIAPFGRIGFNEFFWADILTSLSKVFLDFYFTGCMFFNIHSPSILDANDRCQVSLAFWTPFLLVFPFWVRFWHCVRNIIKFSPSCLCSFRFCSAHPHSTNALKYLMSIAAILFSIVSGRFNHENSVFYYLFLASNFISSFYASLFDLFVDWGLLENLEDRNVTLLRRKLYLSPCYYPLVIVINIFLRFFWLLFAFPMHLWFFAPLVLVVQESVEVFRRILWAILRIEWEQIKLEKQYLVLQ
ncbi:hypothetical protein P9112_004128 [Eukaryota sp. TZLM1-RC]